MSWQAIGVFIAVLGAWSTLLLWALKWMLDRTQSHFDERFKALSDWTRRIEVLERDASDMKRELSREYVRREDWIRFGTTITSKIDGLASQFDGLRERLAHEHRNGPREERA